MPGRNQGKKSKHREIIRERKKKEKDRRVRDILEAAKKVFFTRGYLKATMDKIAVEAEISKPTIYQYFKTKDDLYFSLMLPVIGNIGIQMDKIEKRLHSRKYTSGTRLLKDVLKGFYYCYEKDPDSFRIVQVFQQTGLVGKLKADISSALDEKGRYNFEAGRRIIKEGVKQGLIKKTNPYELVDILWGLFVGLVQLEDIKSQHKGSKKYLGSTLMLAERIISDAMAVK